MRATLYRLTGVPVETIGEEFSIAGSSERFIVHRCIANLPSDPLWDASHLETGVKVGHGSTPDKAITNARMKWNAQPPEVIQVALEKARAFKVANIEKEG